MNVSNIQTFMKMMEVRDNIILEHRTIIDKGTSTVRVSLEHNGMPFTYKGIVLSFERGPVEVDYFTSGSVKIELNKKMSSTISEFFGKELKKWSNEFYSKEY